MAIYWIEHAPNPWVRAIALAVIGGIAIFDYYNAPDIGMWLGGYGACVDMPSGTEPE